MSPSVEGQGRGLHLRSVFAAPEGVLPTVRQSSWTIGWASAALLALTTLADVVISPRVAVLTGLLGLGPLLAASALTPRSTAAFAGAAVILAAVSGLWNDVGVQYGVILLNVALVSALSVIVSVIRAGREADLRDSRRIAGAAQEALLPVLPESLGPVRIGTRYHSATGTAQVGGDFFDFVAEGNRLRFLLGDVSGKGVGAVTEAARVIRAFRQYGASEEDLVSVARRVHEYVTPFWDVERYATAVFVEINGPDRVAVVAAGHPAPLRASADGVHELAVHHCLPLGIGPADHVTMHRWNPSDRLLLYTDGLTEARNTAGEFLPTARIEAALREGSPDACLDELLHRVQVHAGRFTDDLALVLLTNAASAAGISPPATSDARP
ncbi:PP2C family protein-serine/threonine phosphatase [Terrabacter terrae]|uniref:PP2C family protein-serine/threonine phosphatase n=1 Tax=Terrabacter terrae TaxID=318434 RepID=UPI0031E42A75